MDVGVKQQIPTVRVDAPKLGEALHGLLVNAIGGPSMPGRVEIVASVRASEVIVSFHREYAAAAGRSMTPAGSTGQRNSPRKLSEVHAALLLARARRIIKAHGGSIRVETQGKYGNSWTMSLPAAVEQLTQNK